MTPYAGCSPNRNSNETGIFNAFSQFVAHKGHTGNFLSLNASLDILENWYRLSWFAILVNFNSISTGSGVC